MNDNVNSWKPMVSIVIPVYNGSDYLQQAVDSALRQDYPNVEVIVINDGSSDEGKTEKIALSYGSKIRYYHKTNGGVATALNLGIQVMRGEYFSWLSHDDLYGKKKISAQVELLNSMKDKTTPVAGGYALFSDDKRILDIRDYVKIYRQEQLQTPLFPIFHCALNGCTLLIHKSHFQIAGQFDPSYVTTQDYDMWFRMMRGLNIVYCRGIHVYSRVHKNQGSIALGENHNEECNAMWIRFMEQLSEEEKTQIAGSPYGFYKQVFQFFKAHTSYDKAVTYALNQCLRYDGSVPIESSEQLDSKDIVSIRKHLSLSYLCKAVFRKVESAKYALQLQKVMK